MPVPATTGSFKTNILDMSIGDYIAFKYAATSGTNGTFSDIGAELATAQANEIPVAGSATPNGYAYAVKVASGLLVSDRIVQHSIAWSALNAAKLIQGKVIIPSTMIPVMTSNIAPSGIVSVSSEISAYPGYRCLNATYYDLSTSPNDYWNAGVGVTSGWISYEFPSNTLVTGYGFKTINTYTTRCPKEWTLEGSNNGTDWAILHSGSLASGNDTMNRYRFSNSVAYKKYRLNISNTFGDMLSLDKFELYDIGNILVRSLTGGIAYMGNDGLPTATGPLVKSDITDQSYIIDGGHFGDKNGAFDNITGAYQTGWESNIVTACWIGQHFPSPIIVDEYSIQAPSDYFNSGGGNTGGSSPYAWNFEGSNDGINWKILHSITGKIWTSSEKQTYSINNNTAYSYYRINVTQIISTNEPAACMFNEIEMFEKIAFSQSSLAWPEINEFDKYILNSNLDGKITAGDDNVWHYSPVRSLCKETPSIATPTDRTLRGIDNKFSYGTATTVSTAHGFRPVFEFLELDAKATTFWY